MSLRWKLFRFLTVDPLLDAGAARDDSALAFGDVALFPALAVEPDESKNTRDRLLRRLSVAAERALDYDAAEGLYALAMPRGVVQIFNLAGVLVGPSDVLHTSIPMHSTLSAHDSVVAVAVVRQASTALPLIATLGINDNSASLKFWSFAKSKLLPHPLAPGDKLSASLGQDLATTRPSFYSAHQTDDSEGAASGRAAEGTNHLTCGATYRYSLECRPTTLAVLDANVPSPDLFSAAVGFDDGSVSVLNGDILGERASRVRVATAPGEMSTARPVVFAEFAGPLLFCVTEGSVVAISMAVASTPHTHQRGDRSYHRDVLDTRGAPRRQMCCVLGGSAELVVAREEALYFFNRDGRGPCLAFPSEGETASISHVGPYVLHSTGPGLVVAYDLANKLIAYRGKGEVLCVFPDMGQDPPSALLCMVDGSMLRLSEARLQERVSMLLSRGLYIPAVALARAQSNSTPGRPAPLLTQAIRRYAEFLMSKGRYGDAAEQLVGTIGGNVEPSWVITRLVEQSGLRSGLRLYLEALHAAGRAEFVHTKVLITCYRHDRARATILGAKEADKTTDEYVIKVLSGVDWTEAQVDVAIDMCRDAGLHKVAERVARSCGRHVRLATTLVDDLNDVPGCLSLLKSLPQIEAVHVLRACARQLLVRDPASFVSYLADEICKSTAVMPAGTSDPVVRLSDYVHLFVDMPRWRAILLERVLGRPGGILAAHAPKAWLMLFESLVCVDVGDRFQQEANAAPLPPSSMLPRRIGPANLESPQKPVRSDPGVLTRHKAEGNVTHQIGRRALKILQSRRSAIDLRDALRISELYGHDPCLEYLYEQLRMYKELGVSLRMTRNGQSLLRACRRHGEREPLLWLEAIRLFAPLAANKLDDNASVPEAENEDRDEVRLVQSQSEVQEQDANKNRGIFVEGFVGTLGHTPQEVLEEAIIALDHSGIMSPVEIVDAVTDSCPGASWGLVREYFERAVVSLARNAAEEEHIALRLDSELADLRQEVTRLGEEAVLIKPRVCTACEDGISVPAVHFFCGHSFHASCLAPSSMSPIRGDSSGLSDQTGGMWAEECPRCAPELDAVVSMRQALQDKNARHDEFFGKLRSSRDGFSTVIEFLERSPFI